MQDLQDKAPSNDSSLLLGLFILFLLSSPFLMLWGRPGSEWYLPYLVWLGIILLIAWVNGRRRDEP